MSPDLADPGQMQPPSWPARRQQPRRGRVGDEDGRDASRNSSARPARQELAQDLRAALDHQAADPAPGQVFEDPQQVQAVRKTPSTPGTGTTMPAARSRARRLIGRLGRGIDQRRASASAKNRLAGSRSPRLVTVTFSGLAAGPVATRSCRLAGDLTSSRGLSARIVCAPTRIASLPARSSSTRSRSAASDSTSRLAEASSSSRRRTSPPTAARTAGEALSLRTADCPSETPRAETIPSRAWRQPGGQDHGGGLSPAGP